MMKKPFLYGIAACLGLLTVVDAQTNQPGDDPFDGTGAELKQIRVQVEYIDVSHEQFTELMFGAKPATNDGELRQQVAQLIKDGQATVVETQLCTSRSGRKASSESVEEFIYPTEYEPAELPANIHIKGKMEAAMAKGKRPDLATGPTPTAFDTRNVGSTLEIESILSSDHKIIRLRLVPEIVYHVGNRIWAEWKGEHGNSPIQMATFYTVRVNTEVTLSDGHYLLAAALSPKSKEGTPDFSRKLMIFVKADVITADR